MVRGWRVGEFGEHGDDTALLEWKCLKDRAGISMIHGYVQCQVQCLAHWVANKFILIEGVNEESVSSCLGSQGKLQDLMHIPLGSYSGKTRLKVEIQEFWTQTSHVERRLCFLEMYWRRKWNFRSIRERMGGEVDIWGLGWDLRQGVDCLRKTECLCWCLKERDERSS